MPQDRTPVDPINPVDLDFRPESYTDFRDPVSLAVNGISGQMRRIMVRDMLTAEGAKRSQHDHVLGPIEPELLEERVSEEFRGAAFGFGGPTWMGGEYLPPLLDGEVEIARIVLRSSTMDVYAVRARRVDDRYHYRMVDEYASEFRLCHETSREPLTLGEMIELLETAAGDGADFGGAGAVTAWWNQQWRFGDDPEACTAFAWVESELYAGLAVWYEARAAAWRVMREAEDPGRAARSRVRSFLREQEHGSEKRPRMVVPNRPFGPSPSAGSGFLDHPEEVPRPEGFGQKGRCHVSNDLAHFPVCMPGHEHDGQVGK